MKSTHTLNPNDNKLLSHLKYGRTARTIRELQGIQVDQLKGWEAILKPEAFNKLHSWIVSENKKAEQKLTCFFPAAEEGNFTYISGLIKRGTDLDNFIHNNLIFG